MKQSLLVYAVLTISLSSCTNNVKIEEKSNENVSIINIDESGVIDEYNLSEFVTNINYLILETPNTLISLVEDIRVHNGNIFIHDKLNARILIYDIQTGNLINKLQKQGPGPEEYGDISFFDVDESNDAIVIYDVRQGNIYQYDLNGQFLKSISARIICRDFAVNQDGSYLFYSPDEENQSQDNTILETGLLHLSKDGKKIKNILHLGNKSYYPILGVGESLVGNGEYYHLFSNYADTIYTVKNDVIQEKTVLNYNEPLEEYVLDKPSMDLSNVNFPMLKLRPFMSDKYISYTFLHKGQPKAFFYDKIKDSTRIYKLLKNDLNNTPYVLNGKMLKSGDRYVSVINEGLIATYEAVLKMADYPTERKSKLQEIISNYERTNNPILAISTLK